MSAYDGHGTTISFGTSGFSAPLLAIGGLSIERDAIDTTTMATTTAKSYMPADLYDGGTLDLTVEYDGSDSPPIAGATETITINWGGSGNTSVFSGFVTGFTPSAATGERMEASMTVKVTGAIVGL